MSSTSRGVRELVGDRFAAHVCDGESLLPVEKGSVIKEELTRSDNGSGSEGLESVDETGTLLRGGLEKSCLVLAEGNDVGGRLQDITGGTRNVGVAPPDRKEKSANTSHVRSGHRGAREDSKGTQWQGEGGNDTTTWCSERRLQESVQGGSICAEGRNETTSRGGDSAGTTLLRERDLGG